MAFFKEILSTAPPPTIKKEEKNELQLIPLKAIGGFLLT
jgi:hypothetical protein